MVRHNAHAGQRKRAHHHRDGFRGGFHSTVMLTAGFLVFSSSGYEPSWALGILVAITIVFALIADLVLLPALLMAIDRKSPK